MTTSLAMVKWLLMNFSGHVDYYYYCKVENWFCCSTNVIKFQLDFEVQSEFERVHFLKRYLAL